MIWKSEDYPDSKVCGANMGPTWVLSAPGGPHVGPTNLVIREHLWLLAMCSDDDDEDDNEDDDDDDDNDYDDHDEDIVVDDDDGDNGDDDDNMFSNIKHEFYSFGTYYLSDNVLVLWQYKYRNQLSQSSSYWLIFMHNFSCTIECRYPIAHKIWIKYQVLFSFHCIGPVNASCKFYWLDAWSPTGGMM